MMLILVYIFYQYCITTLSNAVGIIGLPTFVLITGMICSVLTWSYNVDVPAERSILKFQHHYGTKVPGLQP